MSVIYKRQRQYDEIMNKVFARIEVYITNTFEGLALRINNGRTFAKFHKGEEYEIFDTEARDQATDIIYNAYSEANEITKAEYENW